MVDISLHVPAPFSPFAPESSLYTPPGLTLRNSGISHRGNLFFSQFWRICSVILHETDFCDWYV